MLAQNFKSAADLGITDKEWEALCKTLKLLETDKLTHIPTENLNTSSYDREFTGGFNMCVWHATHNCGSAGCIGGTAEMIGNLTFRDNIPQELFELFYPDLGHTEKYMGEITTAEAATALRSYLTTGEARWDLAVPA